MKNLKKKKQVTLLAGLSLAIFLLPACYAENSGTFTATMGDNQYEVKIACSNLDKDYFTFRSDKSDVSDSDGDGLIISGDQMKKGSIVLTINDHGENYSHPGVILNKTENGAKGSGELWREGGGKAYPVTYELVCK